ncbi:MAG: hypothetical protein J6U52_07045 [Alistipes sp.]|nr:hypothetical protein [Alistipes sp.]MBQ2018902.1 hypothetical protein [Alistipes sp.]MBQ5715231.1 hypothetical protein [Alistipes sp.]
MRCNSIITSFDNNIASGVKFPQIYENKSEKSTVGL